MALYTVLPAGPEKSYLAVYKAANLGGTFNALNISASTGIGTQVQGTTTTWYEAAAQSITPSRNILLTSLVAKVSRFNILPGGDGLYVTVSTALDGTLMATSDNVTDLTSSSQDRTFSFSSPPMLISGVTYYITFRRIGAFSTANYPTVWGGSDVYASGTGYRKESNAWVDRGYDFYLQLYGSGDFVNIAQQVFSSEIKTLSVYFDDSLTNPRLRIVTQTADGRAAYHVYETVADTWNTENELIHTAVNTAHAQWGCGIVKRANGELVSVFMGDTVNVGRYSRRVSDTWQASIPITSHFPVSLTTDSTGRISFFFQNSSTGVLRQTILSASDTLSPNTDIASERSGIGGQYGVNGAAVPISGTSNISLRAATTLADTAGTGFGTETVRTNVTVYDRGSRLAAMAFVANGTEKHVLYVDSTTRDLWHHKNTSTYELDTGIPWSNAFVFGSTTAYRFSQSVTVGSTSISLGGVEWSISKTGSPTDNLSVEVRSGSVTGAVLGVSSTVPGSDLSTGFVKVKFGFPSSINLSANTKYYFIIQRSGSADDTNRYNLTITLDDYTAGGTKAQHANGVWDSAEQPTDLYVGLFSGVVESAEIKTGTIDAISAAAATSTINYLYDDVGVIKYGEVSLGDSTTPVENSVATSWDVEAAPAAVNNSTSTTWNVLSVINTSVSTTYDVRQQISNDTITSWNVASDGVTNVRYATMLVNGVPTKLKIKVGV